MSLSDLVFDPTSPEYRADPYPALSLIRESEPVHQSRMGLLITRYEHVNRVLRDSKVWGRGGTPERLRAQLGDGPMLEYASRRMHNYDPPEHTRLRSLVTKAFTARRIEALKPRIQKIADDLLTAVEGVREFDVLEVLAHPLPCQVICEMIGVPLDDSPQFSKWTEAVHLALSPFVQREHLAPAHAAAGEFMAYIRTLVGKRRARPGEDLLSALVAAEDAGDRLTEEELTATVVFLFTAGHATTRDLVGGGLLALISHRDQWDLLVANPSLVASAVEECLRYAPSVPMNGRLALQDTELGGKQIPAGAMVLASIAAANRDPRRFASLPFMGTDGA
jgi:cytochrome P450